METKSALERRPLRQQIYEILRERILCGELSPGEAVRDVSIAAALGSSRTPVREALVRLTAEGLLHNWVGRGFRVPPLVRSEVEEAHPLVTTLEPLALGLAPPASATRLKRLEALTLRMERSAGNPIALHELDAQWHRCLIEGCPNARLHKYIEELRDVLRRYELAHLSQGEAMHGSLQEHRAIAQAEADQDRVRSTRLLQEHWLRGRSELLARITDEDSTS